jgi:CelD/BcsL family acetyltransferase involved in cellulose biosynthesis
MTDITLTPMKDANALAARWRALEAAATPSPFLTWDFVGAVAAGCTAPHVLAVRENGQDVALAVLNRADKALHLHATGDAARDAVFIEHNGLLVRPGARAVIAPALCYLVRTARVVMPGVDGVHLDAARQAGLITHYQARFAPAVDLTALSGPYLESLSANARAQIRRAIRLYGPDLAVHRATDPRTAAAYFEEMVTLHQASWQARGKPGAFAAESMCAFHRALIAAGPAGRVVDLLRVTAADRTVGILYMLRRDGHVCCYQSGFSRSDDPRAKPGLVCHTRAIELYRSEGAATYDLLAGPARYKATLAGIGGQMLHWFTLYPPGALAALGARARAVAERAAASLRGIGVTARRRTPGDCLP